MAVVSFKEISDGRDGDGELGRRGTVRRYTRVWRAVTDTNTDEAIVVSSHVDCPALGSVYPWDTTAYLRRLSLRQTIGKRVWIVTGGYSSEFEVEENPLTDPAEINWSTDFYEVVAHHDRDGNPIMNTAGAPFDPPPMMSRSIWTVKIRKNYLAVPTWILNYGQYGGAVNSDAVFIDGVSIPANCAKVHSIEVSTAQSRNSVSYRVLTLSLQLKKEGWTLKLLNGGMDAVDPSDSSRRIQCENDKQVPGYGCLKLDGTQLKWPLADFSNVVWLSFNLYPALPFSVLPLN